METTGISVKNALGEDFIQIDYDETNEWIYSRWIGDATVAEVKEGCENMLTQIQDKSCQKVLNDDRDAIGSWDDANEWIEQNWMPRLVASGIKKFAHIISPDIFAAMSVEEIAIKVSGFEMRIFEDEAEAKAWLKS